MPRYSLAECITSACLMEVTAPKPGNVHRGADFEDVAFGDFVLSAVMIGGPLSQAANGVGQAVLEAVKATRACVGTNTNLGMILLLAPLAAVPRTMPLTAGVPQVLANLNAHDAAAYWQAIQLARPGGLGQVAQADLSGPPPSDILAAMQLAAERDRVAAQYANGYAEVFGCVVPWLREGLTRGWDIFTAIVHTHVRMLAEFPDTLIARKLGTALAEQATCFAQQVLAAGAPDEENYHAALADFDFWLRSDGHRRNPGTTADLIAAGLFVLFREDDLDLRGK